MVICHTKGYAPTKTETTSLELMEYLKIRCCYLGTPHGLCTYVHAPPPMYMHPPHGLCTSDFAMYKVRGVVQAPAMYKVRGWYKDLPCTKSVGWYKDLTPRLAVNFDMRPQTSKVSVTNHDARLVGRANSEILARF